MVILGFASLLNDGASETITPRLPVFLTAILGAGPAIVGPIEGTAEATASILKLVAGSLNDRGVGAKRLVFGGYGTANLARPAIGFARPAIGFAIGSPIVMLLRFLDRVGKGNRTAPRDALIAGAAATTIRGRAPADVTGSDAISRPLAESGAKPLIHSARPPLRAVRLSPARRVVMLPAEAPMDRVYANRAEAGQLLGAAVRKRLRAQPAIVLGLPRGGVPVAAPVAAALGAPLDVLIVRKVGVPMQPELAMGAVAPGGVTIRNEDVLAMLPDAARQFGAVAAVERAELVRRERAYRGDRPPLDLTGRAAVLVDDGVATGATLRAAVAAARQLGAARVVVAVPVASREARQMLEDEADEVVCLQVPQSFVSVGGWYADFPQLSDTQVRELLPGS
ncbi:MAG TPA: phosphoribosyltransferase family protein [Steroidobacteraceae bacterium]|nr:phosphoribosyltransferase family protein [Steroidobacteraceae bacterium]